MKRLDVLSYFHVLKVKKAIQIITQKRWKMYIVFHLFFCVER